MTTAELINFFHFSDNVRAAEVRSSWSVIKEDIQPEDLSPVINSTSQSHPISTAGVTLLLCSQHLIMIKPPPPPPPQSSSPPPPPCAGASHPPPPPPPSSSPLRLDQSYGGVMWVLFWAGPASPQEHWILFEVVIRHGRLTCKINTPGSKLPASQRTHSY